MAAALLPAPAAHAAAPAPDSIYVALGDSFAAGPYIAPTDPVTMGCIRSMANYPRLLAARYQISGFRDVTCSGASTGDLFHPQNVRPGPNPPQLEAVHPDTDLVTLQIGGNDIGFGEIVNNCLSLLPIGSPCRLRYETGETDVFDARIAATRHRVDSVLDAIRARAPGARVFVIGYPSLLPENSPGCWPLMPYTASDLPYLIGIEKRLNAMLNEVAADNSAVYVDLYTPSLGRDACRAPPERWVEPLLLPLAAPVHPNLGGMVGMEGVIAAAIEAAAP